MINEEHFGEMLKTKTDPLNSTNRGKTDFAKE